MRTPAPVPVLCLCLVAVYAATAVAAPEWTRSKGLDFWNSGHEKERFQEATAQHDELDARYDSVRKRSAMGTDIANRLRDGQMSLPEAVDSLVALASNSPGWFGQLRVAYGCYGWLTPTATDRDVAICYLAAKLEPVGGPGGPNDRSHSEQTIATRDRIARFHEELDTLPALMVAMMNE